MVGIVFVSHSAKIAEGVKDLANQMVQGQVPLAAAGGIDDPDNPIGTDAMKVLEAIESVYSEDGVIVLMDLGSALLSAEMALELIDPEKRTRVNLSPAPFVEGALAAAVQASVGGTRADVLHEAQGALAMKLGQLQEPPAGTGDSAIETSPILTGDEITISLVLNNRLGLHARPATQFVTTANKYSAEVQVIKDNKWANAKSINQVVMLGIGQGHEIQIVARGVDADEVLAELKALVESNFGESYEEVDAPAPVPARVSLVAKDAMTGIAASPGVAVGPAALYRPKLSPVQTYTVEDPAAEWTRLEKAISNAIQKIQVLRNQAEQQIGSAEAAIFAAHVLILQDPVMIENVKNKILSERINAESVWDQEIKKMRAQFQALDNDYIKAREADVEDVGQRVLMELTEVQPPVMIFEQPSILIAADLSPSEAARLDPSKVLGICTERGGAMSHSVILARALGIPAVVGLGSTVWTVVEGRTIGVDGERGLLWVQPDEALLNDLHEKRQAWQRTQQQAKLAGLEPALTRDGRRLGIAANISGLHDVGIALEYGAEGVGLFRTEFLFMGRDEMPSEEEQANVYVRTAQALGDRPLIIRTLDVGGDKPLPYIELGEEANPFLGWRGIRFCLDQPEMFKSQLRAILRASHERNIKIMFPMVGSVPELRAAKAMVEEVQTDLRYAGLPFNENMQIGIMIEVPSAVITADFLAGEVDFFSIGTNDLAQYAMAADRGNSHVAELAQGLQPAVLRMIKQTVDAAHASGISVGMCGELAGNVLAVPVLVGLGLDQLSMTAPSIPTVKELIRQLSYDDAQKVAAKVLLMDSVAAVVEYLSSKFNTTEVVT